MALAIVNSGEVRAIKKHIADIMYGTTIDDNSIVSVLATYRSMVDSGDLPEWREEIIDAVEVGKMIDPTGGQAWKNTAKIVLESTYDLVSLGKVRPSVLFLESSKIETELKEEKKEAILKPFTLPAEQVKKAKTALYIGAGVGALLLSLYAYSLYTVNRSVR